MARDCTTTNVLAHPARDHGNDWICEYSYKCKINIIFVKTYLCPLGVEYSFKASISNVEEAIKTFSSHLQIITQYLIAQLILIFHELRRILSGSL